MRGLSSFVDVFQKRVDFEKKKRFLKDCVRTVIWLSHIFHLDRRNNYIYIRLIIQHRLRLSSLMC